MDNILIKQYDSNGNEMGLVGLYSQITYNATEYYRIFFNQEIENVGFKANEYYYVRGFGNIDGKLFVSYYKSWKREIVNVAYSIQEHQENMRKIADMINEEY